jgi:hypothetical protein
MILMGIPSPYFFALKEYLFSDLDQKHVAWTHGQRCNTNDVLLALERTENLLKREWPKVLAMARQLIITSRSRVI